MLTSVPTLAYADFTQPFMSQTNRSMEGLGVVLSQVQNGQERVIAYASRSLRDNGKNLDSYSTFKI